MFDERSDGDVDDAARLRGAPKRERNVPLEEDPGAAVFPNEESRDLFRAVTALPEAYRIAVHLHYYEDYSIREIARILRLPQATVKTRLFRGRQLLRQALEEESK